MALEELLKILSSGDDYTCEYGIGRVESYGIGLDGIFGYDSSGNFKQMELTSEDFDIDALKSLSRVTEIYRKK